MPDEVTWTVSEPSGKVNVVSNRKLLKYREEIAITEKMAKTQIPFAEGWNAMRERLIEIGEMEEGK